MSARSARAALAAGVVALCTLTMGCAAGEAPAHPSPPIFGLFGVQQQTQDRLPEGSSGVLLIAPESSRLLGSVGMHRFYVALGRVGVAYCVIVTTIYDVEVAAHCGGDQFGGEYANGLRFEFGSTAAPYVPGAPSNFGLGDHLTVGADSVEAADFPAVVALMGRAQAPEDSPPAAARLDGFIVEGRMRLLAVDGDRSFFLGLTEWPAAPMCLFESGGAGTIEFFGGTCGGRDIVLDAPSILTAHFSAAGFEGETPEGWRQLSPLLRVKYAAAE